MLCCQLVSFDRSYNTGAIDLKIDGSVLEEKSSFKMLGLSFSSKLDLGSYIISIAKTALIGDLIGSMNLPYSLACNTVFMSGVVLLAVTCKC